MAFAEPVAAESGSAQSSCSVSSVGHWVLIRASSFRAPTCCRNPVNPNKVLTKPGTPSDATGRFVSAILGNTEAEWTDIFAQAGKKYQPPTLSCFLELPSRVAGLRNRLWVRSIAPLIRKYTLTRVSFRISSDASALAMSAARRASFPSLCDCARDRTSCPEPVGALPEVQQAQRGMGKAEANSLQVRVELQADCLPASGRTARMLNGNSSNLGTSKRRYRRLRRSAMIDCRNRARATLSRTPSPTALRHSAPVGS